MKTLLAFIAVLFGFPFVSLAQPLQRQFLTTNTAGVITFSDTGAHTLWGFDTTDNAAIPITIGPNLTYNHATHSIDLTVVALTNNETRAITIRSNLTMIATGIGTTVPTNQFAIVLTNAEVATAGNPKNSPGITLGSHGWDTDSGGFDTPMDWYVYSVPSSAAAPSSTLTFAYSREGAAPSVKFTISDTGVAAFGSTSLAPSTGAFGWTTRSRIYSPADGRVQFVNNAVSAGAQVEALSFIGTNGFYTIAPTNGVAPPTSVLQPLGFFGSMMKLATNSQVANGVYVAITNFATVSTNGFAANPAAGFLTNTVAGFYRITINCSIQPGNSDVIEGEVFLDETERDELAIFSHYDNPSRVRTMSATGVLYLPANTGISFRLKNSSANNMDIWRAAITVGTP